MKADKRSFGVVAAVLVLVTGGTAHAIMVGAGRFDQMIDGASIIVKGRISQVDEPPFEMIAFRAEVIEVLKSDGGEIPSSVHLEVPMPIWPDDLGIEYAEKQYVLMVLQRQNGKICVVNNLGAILPASDSNTPFEPNRPAKRKVFGELRACLDQTKDEKAKGLLLVHLSQLGTEQDENIFLPYLKSGNEWLRRGALASLIRINCSEELIRQTRDDFVQHISSPSTTAEDLLFWKMYVDIKWCARCGSFGMDKVLTARAQAYLPIYRALIDKAPAGYQQVSVAIDALKDVGTREDIGRLYKYIDSDKASIRHEVLEGIGRILGMSVKRPRITSYMLPLPEEIGNWEAETRSIIDQKLKSEHLLEK